MPDAPGAKTDEAAEVAAIDVPASPPTRLCNINRNQIQNEAPFALLQEELRGMSEVLV